MYGKIDFKVEKDLELERNSAEPNRKYFCAKGCSIYAFYKDAKEFEPILAFMVVSVSAKGWRWEGIRICENGKPGTFVLRNKLEDFVLASSIISFTRVQRDLDMQKLVWDITHFMNPDKAYKDGRQYTYVIKPNHELNQLFIKDEVFTALFTESLIEFDIPSKRLKDNCNNGLILVDSNMFEAKIGV